MTPTLLPGQQVFITRDGNSLTSLSRSDIIVLQTLTAHTLILTTWSKGSLDYPGKRYSYVKATHTLMGQKFTRAIWRRIMKIGPLLGTL